MNIDLYDESGHKKGSVKLNPRIFETKINPDLIHRAVILRQSNARKPVAHSLTRGEISATTAKAFRQKGTGRARRGALSTNLLRGGGVTHGPRNKKNFVKSMPKKERRSALFSSLSSKAREKEIFAWEAPELKQPKTKPLADLITKLPEATKYLFVLPEKNDQTIIFQKSVSNIPQIKTILASYLNPYDILEAEKVCFVGDSISRIEETFLNKEK